MSPRCATLNPDIAFDFFASSLTGAARDDHRQNLIFSPLTNRGENPTSKKIDLRCHRVRVAGGPLMTADAP